MPFVNPMLFGTSSSQYDAIIEFGSYSYPSGTTGNLAGSLPTIIKDPLNLFGTVRNFTDKKWVAFNTFGDYRFTQIEPAVFSAKGGSSNVKFSYVWGDVNQQTINTDFQIMVIYDSASVDPGPTDYTITNNAIYEDGLAIIFPSSVESGSFTGMTMGVKKL